MKSLFIFLLLCFLVLSGCAEKPVQPKILEEMAKLDRAYVPALVFTGLEKQRESELALERLKKAWEIFYSKFHATEMRYGLDITDKFWEEDFEQMNALIMSAEVLARDRKLNEAHEKLLELQDIFRELRHRNNLKYFLDGMTEFYTYTQVILFIVEENEELRDRDLENLRALFKGAQGCWFELARGDYDLLIFGFDKKKIKSVKKRIKEEERLLAQFAAALSSKDRDRIYEAAHNLNSNYLALFKAFGDFEPVFARIRSEKKPLDAEQRRGTRGKEDRNGQ